MYIWKPACFRDKQIGKWFCSEGFWCSDPSLFNHHITSLCAWWNIVNITNFNTYKNLELFFDYHVFLMYGNVYWFCGNTSSFLQVWTTLPVWAVPPGHIGWPSTWATRLLVELWKSLGDRKNSCNLSCEGLQVFPISISIIFFIAVWHCHFTHSAALLLHQLSNCFLLDGLVLRDCWRGRFQWWKT